MGKRPLRSTGGGGVGGAFSSSPPPSSTASSPPPPPPIQSDSPYYYHRRPAPPSSSASSRCNKGSRRKGYVVVGFLFVLSFLYALVYFESLPNLHHLYSNNNNWGVTTTTTTTISCDNQLDGGSNGDGSGGTTSEEKGTVSSSSNNDQTTTKLLLNQLIPMAIPGGEVFVSEEEEDVSTTASRRRRRQQQQQQQQQLQLMLNRKEFCLSWKINTDIWWTHHVDWYVSFENKTHYCFAPMEDVEKSNFFQRLYSAQFKTDCTKLRIKQMWSSGWGADIRNVIETLHYAYQQNKPIQMYYEKGWHYAATKLFNNPVCPSADMYCYFLNMTNCQVDPNNNMEPPENQRFTDVWPPLEGRPWNWYKEYATRQQTWLRHEVYQYVEETLQEMGLSKMLLAEGDGTKCATMHVRRADVTLHVGENRDYYSIQEYIQGTKEILGQQQGQQEALPRNILLLTDDENAIEEARRDFPQYNWFTIHRKRHKGNSGGFENQLPSGDPKTEVVVLLATFQLIQKCPIFIHARSSLAEYMWGILQEKYDVSGGGRKAKRINLIDWMNTHHNHTVHHR